MWTNAQGLSHLKGVERPVYLWNSVWYVSVRVTLGARVASDCREKVEDLCVAKTLCVWRAFQLRLFNRLSGGLGASEAIFAVTRRFLGLTLVESVTHQGGLVVSILWR